MHDHKDRDHHGAPPRRRPLWLLALGAVGLLVLIAGGIAAGGLAGGELLARPPGDASAPVPAVAAMTAPTASLLPVGRDADGLSECLSRRHAPSPSMVFRGPPASLGPGRKLVPTAHALSAAA